MPSQPLLPSPVLDVECAENEEVVWHYTVTLEGQFVSGYSIVPRFGNFMNPPVPKRRPIGFTADLSKKS